MNKNVKEMESQLSISFILLISFKIKNIIPNKRYYALHENMVGCVKGILHDIFNGIIDVN